MNYKKRLYTKYKLLIFIFLSMVTTLYSSGGNFLQNVTFFNLMAFFSFLMLVVLIISSLFIDTKKVMLKTFVLWLSLFIVGKVEAWYLSYIPSVSYFTEEPYGYGVYEEDSKIECLRDENITALIKDESLLYVKTDIGIQRISRYSTYARNAYEEDKEFWCKEKLKIENLNRYKMVMTFREGTKVFILDDNNKTLSVYDYLYNEKKHINFFKKMENKTLKQYLKENSMNQIYDGKQNKLFTENYDCNCTGYTGIIMDKKEKYFYLCKKKKRYQTTHLNYTPKIATYIPDSDTILIAYEEKKGLYILRNKYTKIYNHIQDSVTVLLKALNQPKWNKPDLSKIKLDQNKLKKIIDIFTPYEKNQHHSVYYSVINYDGHQATVKANIDNKDTVLFNLKLEKGNWNIKKRE